MSDIANQQMKRKDPWMLKREEREKSNFDVDVGFSVRKRTWRPGDGTSSWDENGDKTGKSWRRCQASAAHHHLNSTSQASNHHLVFGSSDQQPNLRYLPLLCLTNSTTCTPSHLSTSPIPLVSAVQKVEVPCKNQWEMRGKPVDRGVKCPLKIVG